MLAGKKPSINSRSTLLVIIFLETCNGTLRDLNAGFNLSVRAALDSYGRVIKAHSAADGHAFFVPFLSSSTFNSTNSSESLGFAVGFLFLNGSSVTASLAIDRQELEDGIYLAVCGGTSGNHSNLIEGKLPFLNGVHDAEFNVAADGYVVPVWIFRKVQRPLKSVNGSLVIVKTQVMKTELQLQDNNSSTEVLAVSTTSTMEMEMQDSGNFVVWGSRNKTDAIFDTDSELTNTLVQGKKLLVGKQLTSSNGDYSAQMKAGGLVLVANNVQLVAGQPSPYWIFPIHFRNDTYDSNGDVLLNSGVNDLIASSPCASSNVDDDAFGMLGMSSLQFFLDAGSCSKDPSFRGPQRAFLATGRSGDFPISWSFSKIENDGRLYINAVINNNSTVLTGTPATVRYAFDSAESNFTVEGSDYNRSIAIRVAAPFVWGGCDVPMACGPLGICTPEVPARVSCSCPSSDFDIIDPKDSSQGCQLPASSLPACNSSEYSLIRASSILLFGDWKYALLSSDHVCRLECSSSCSCIGFFLNEETGRCLLILASKISFINSAKNFRAISLADLPELNYNATYNVSTGSYTTYLKVKEVKEVDLSRLITVFEWVRIIIIFALLILACCCCCCGCRCFRAIQRRRRRQRNLLVEEEELRDFLSVMPIRFSYKELQAATNRFGKLLGSGGCGSVYSGVLSDGRKVAVKQLVSSMLISGQSKQLLAELATVGRTNHLNVVRLLGFCWEDLQRLLVYEFVEKGSLDAWLFIQDSARVDHNGLPAASELDWPTRYNVARGIARGLSYLHEECEPPVLHFDIKPQNILLDETFVAKLADFGMSRLIQRGLKRL